MRPVSMEALEARAAHQRIAAAIGGLHAEVRPRADWQARVLASVRARAAVVELKAVETAAAEAAEAVAQVAPTREAEAPSAPATLPATPWWKRLLPVAPPFALACAAALALLVMPRAPEPAAPVLVLELADAGAPHAATAGRNRSEGGDAARSGAAPALGAQLQLSAQSEAPYRALWVFRGRDELVLQCPGAGCTQTPAALAASLRIDRIGEHTVLALSSATPLPAPPATLDAALALAERSGVAHRSQRFTVW